MNRWHSGVGGVRRGPVGDADLRTLAATGQLQPTDLAWREGLSEWVPAGKVKGLFPTDRPPPLPATGPPPLPVRPTVRAVADSTDPPRPRRRPSARGRTAADSTGAPAYRWQAWEIWVYLILTLGLFGLYLIPSWGKSMERITGRPRMPAAAVRVLGVCSLGVVLGVMQIVCAYQLAERSRRVGTPRSNPKLGSWVLWPSVVSFVWSLGTAGIGFLVGGFALAIHSVWLVQEELNLYGGDGVAHPWHS